MPVFRVNKDKENPYMMVNKFFIHDNRLSLKAKGLMSIFLSRPDDWEFYHKEILKHCRDGKDSFNSALSQLIETGYIKRDLRRDENGKLLGGYNYTVYETPMEISEKDIASTESTESGKTEIGKNRYREKPISENPPLLNKELKLNNDLKLNKETTTNKSSGSKGNIEVFKYFEKCGFGLLSAIMLEKIASDIEIYGKEWVMKAAEVADGAGKHNYNYVKGILENWKTNGIKENVRSLGNKKEREKDESNKQSFKPGVDESGIGFHF